MIIFSSCKAKDGAKASSSERSGSGLGAPICMLYTGTEAVRHFPANERTEDPVFESPSERKELP